MREIKFRFWSNHLGKFVIPSDNIFAGALKDPNMNPQQFTGLLDKDGKEIYEGDIVQLWNKGGYTDKELRPTGILRAVEWRESKNGIGFNIGLGKYGRHEVLGNIYEDPELVI